MEPTDWTTGDLLSVQGDSTVTNAQSGQQRSQREPIELLIRVVTWSLVIVSGLGLVFYIASRTMGQGWIDLSTLYSDMGIPVTMILLVALIVLRWRNPKPRPRRDRPEDDLRD